MPEKGLVGAGKMARWRHGWDEVVQKNLIGFVDVGAGFSRSGHDWEMGGRWVGDGWTTGGRWVGDCAGNSFSSD
jgi:hypothetical protein